ncbi:MAG TPA: FkbM family methyltransferase [Pyrinomonadaceae bacterium]|jgi:FkbM family methyltransferase
MKMNDVTQRIAALSPEKLALLERRLNKGHTRSADSARPQPDDKVEPFSHDDSPVELSSARIEPGEIEAVLKQHPTVQESAVAVWNHGAGDRRVVAYLVPDQKHAGPVRQLLQFESENRMAGRLRYELPNGMVIFHMNRSETAFLYQEIFEEQSYLKHGITLEQKACVFDLGANIGLFTLFVAQTREDVEVYAFEPIPPIFDVLRLNTALYGLNVRLFNLGIANETGTASFSYYPHASSFSGRYPDPITERETVKTFLRAQQQLDAHAVALSEEEIDALLQARLTSEQIICPVKTLSQVIHENGVEKIDLLKVDVEKSELDVFEGIDKGDWPRIRQVVVEVHDIDGRLKRITDLLEGYGYKLTVEQEMVLKETGLYNIYAVRPSENGAALSVKREQASPKSDRSWSSPERLINDVRQFAQENLPEQMIPNAFVLLNALPLTPDGKVDYSAITPADGERTRLKELFVAPRTPMEAALARIWVEVLGLNQVGAHDNFFELGGNRLLATQVISRAQDMFQVELTLRSFIDQPTVASLASAITRSLGGAKESINSNTTGQINHNQDEQLLAQLDRISDEDVNSFLSYLIAEEEEATANALPLTKPALAEFDRRDESKEPHLVTIDKISRSEGKDLLANLDQLADEDVDSLLTGMFDEEEVLEARSAINFAPAMTRSQGAPGSEQLSAIPYAQTRSSAGGHTLAIDALAGEAAPAQVQRLFEKIYLRYVRALQEAGMSAQRRAEEAHFNYAWSLQEAWMEDRKEEQLEEAAKNYVDALREAQSDSRNRFEDAYLTYVRALRETWMRLDVDAIDPGSLAAVSHNMAMAATFAGSTLSIV